MSFPVVKMESGNISATAANKTPPQCHAWLKDELPPGNITLEILNYQLMRRNIGGISLLAILIPIGLIGNLHVLIAYLKYFKKSNYKVYVLWLAMIDIINCSVVAPFVIAYLFFPVMYPSAILCKVFRFVLYTTAIVSTSSLIVIAIDRHKKVVNPLGSHFKTTTAKVLCFCCLIFAVFLAWPAPILFGLAHIKTGIPGIIGSRCFMEDSFRDTNYMAYYNFILVLFFLVVTTILLIVYVRIGRHISQHNAFRNSIRRKSAISIDAGKDNNKKAAQKTTMTLCAVTFAYVLSAFPHHLLAIIIFVVKGFDCSLSLFGAQMYYTFIWSYFVNSVVNPFIYAIRDKKFWIAVKKLYGR